MTHLEPPRRPGLWSRLTSDTTVVACLGLLGGVVLLAVAAPVLPLSDPNAVALDERLLPPLSNGHWLGTDQLGRDLLARLLHGARLSLFVALLGVLLAACVGSGLGMLSGYYGGRVDGTLMRLVDVLMAFPYLLLALAIVAVLGPGLDHATLAIAIVNVPFFARTVRGRTLSLSREMFVDAARVAGFSDTRILLGEILPSLGATVIVAASTSCGWMILETAGLSFLGLGAKPPTADLGGMLGQGRHLLATAPHVSLIPGGLIFFLVALLNVVGDGLRDALDPRHQPTSKQMLDDSESVPASQSPKPAGALLCVQNLSVSFEDVAAVRDVSFSLAPGDKLALVGESGSGKSVTSLAILGLLPSAARASQDAIEFEGSPLTAENAFKVRGSGLAWIPQDPMTSLHPLLRVERQLGEVLRLHTGLTGDQAQRRALELLSEVGISDPKARLSAFPHQLSGGMRQRIVIAMALAGNPKLLIADEPTTALDVTTQASVLRCLEELCSRRGAALLFISHDLAVVSQLCDRVLVMQRGRVVETGSSTQLIRTPRHPYTRQLLASVPELGAPARLLTSEEGE